MGPGGLAALDIGGQLLQSTVENEQQKNNQERQYFYNKRLQSENQRLAVKTWNETNAEAQVEHLRNAGLSTGLMYKSGGVQGQTSSQPSSVGMGDSTARIDAGGAALKGMALEMQKAQIDNIKADTAQKVAGLPKPTADIANVQADTAKKTQETSNAKLQGELLAIEKTMRNETLQDVIKQAAAVSDKAVGEAISARAKGEIDEATYNDKIKQIKQDTTEQQLRMAATKIGMNVSKQQLVNMATQVNMMTQENMRQWDKMSQTDKEIAVKQLLGQNATTQTEFNTSTAAQLKQWTSIIGDLMSLKTKQQSGHSETINNDTGESKTTFWNTKQH